MRETLLGLLMKQLGSMLHRLESKKTPLLRYLSTMPRRKSLLSLQYRGRDVDWRSFSTELSCETASETRLRSVNDANLLMLLDYCPAYLVLLHRLLASSDIKNHYDVDGRQAPL